MSKTDTHVYILLAQDRHKWLAVVNTAMNLGVFKLVGIS